MIRLRDVSKRYRSLRSTTVALDGLNLLVPVGEFVALVGPNGAGKSTLFGVLLGFLRPDGGSATVGGLDPREWVRQNGVGYLPEVPSIPRRWRARETLIRLGVLDGLRRSDLDRQVDAALERTGLTARCATRTGALSKGSRQRLAIAQLLLQPRTLMLLDEPFAGLDPFWRSGLRELLTQLRRDRPATTIIMASHDLAEVGRLADRVVMLADGRVRRELGCPRDAGVDLDLALLSEAGVGGPPHRAGR